MRAIPTVLLLALGLCVSAPLANAAGTARGPNFIVFFQEWSAAIDKSATSVIGAAAKAAAANPNATLHVTGFADTTGGSKANVYLTELRAQVVTDALQADGVPAGRIQQAAEGSVPSIGTKQESRRVTISLSQSP